MKRFRRRRRSIRRRRSLNSTIWGPILKLLAVILGVAGIAALIIFVALPKLLPLVGIEYYGPFAETPTPAPTPSPTPTPHPMDQFDMAAARKEVVFESNQSYKWYSDPYIYDGEMVIAAGELVDAKACLKNLFYYEPETRTSRRIDLPLENSHFLYPKFNDRWLVYLDAGFSGGGKLMAVSLGEGSATPEVIKEVYTGQPEPMLDGDYVAWTERTGTKMDKLFVCDLRTFETTTVHLFSNSPYGQSLPSLRDGVLVWADAENTGVDEADEVSIIYSIELGAPNIASYSPDTYVHDPERVGDVTAWLSGNHGEDTKLFYSAGGGEPVLVAEGVTEFGLEEKFIAYCSGETIYAYYLDNKTTYRVSADYEVAMFLGVSDSSVIWMDVTSRERDIVKFARID